MSKKVTYTNPSNGRQAEYTETRLTNYDKSVEIKSKDGTVIARGELTLSERERIEDEDAKRETRAKDTSDLIRRED